MEADIIATGFWLSETMHGVQYAQVIGDEDSSVLYTIQAKIQSYGRRDVVKIECANHAVKYYRSRLEQLINDFPSSVGEVALPNLQLWKLHMVHAVLFAIIPQETTSQN